MNVIFFLFLEKGNQITHDRWIRNDHAMWRIKTRDCWILTMLRGIIVVVVVGQEPLVIHVVPDGDTPRQKRRLVAIFVSRTRIRSPHSSHTVNTPHVRYTSTKFAERERSSPCQVRRDITNFCHPRRFTKGASTFTGILAFTCFTFYWQESKAAILAFEEFSDRTAQMSDAEWIWNLNREIEETK